VLAFSAETQVKVEVKGDKGKAQTATIDVDGKVTVVKVGDLAEGESKTIGEGESAVKVTRKGDALIVETPEGDQGAEARHVFVLSGDEGDVPIRKRIIVRRLGGDDEGEDIEVYELPDVERIEARVRALVGKAHGERLARVHERLLRAKERRHQLDEKMQALREKMKGLAKRLKKLNLEGQAEVNDALLEHLEKLQEIEIPPIPPIEIDEDLVRMPHRAHGSAWSWVTTGEDEADTVVLTCDKDDVTIVLPKEAAAGRTITCPVCGQPMTKAGPGNGSHKVIIRKKVEKQKEE